MGFRFQKRINIGKGIGLNISKSGITSSIRTKSGSLGTKGYSVKTGISGVSYRKNFSNSKNSGCIVFLIIPIAIIILKNL